MGENKQVAPQDALGASPPLYQSCGVRRAVRRRRRAVTEAGDPITNWLDAAHFGLIGKHPNTHIQPRSIYGGRLNVSVPLQIW